PWRQLPEYQRNQRHQPQGKILRTLDGAGPDRLIQRRQQQPHHRRVDARQGRLGPLTVPQLCPERQGADHQQERRQEDGAQGDQPGEPARQAGIHCCAEEGGEGEQRAGDGLGRAIAGKKGIDIQQPGLDRLGLQQRQHDVAPAKYQRADPVEAVDNTQQLTGEQAGQQRQTHQQYQEQAKRQAAGPAADPHGQVILLLLGSRLDQQHTEQARAQQYQGLTPDEGQQQYQYRTGGHQGDPQAI